MNRSGEASIHQLAEAKSEPPEAVVVRVTGTTQPIVRV